MNFMTALPSSIISMGLSALRIRQSLRTRDRFGRGGEHCRLLRRITFMHLSALLVAIVAAALSGCGTIPDVNALLHTNPLYVVDPNFVGPNGPLTTRQARHILARLKANQDVPTNILQRQIAFEEALSNSPLVLGNKVKLLENGASTYSAMLAAIHSARDSINIQMYIFSGGPTGQMFSDALIERQHHGVQVNVMYDSLGSIATPAGFFDRMRENGISVLQYRPVNPLEATLGWSIAHRNHRKMLVVDGRVAFTGGINISEVYASKPVVSGEHGPLEGWRDTDIEVTGPAVAEFQRSFISEWQYQHGPALSPRNYFPQLTREGSEIVQVIGSVPQRFSTIYVVLVGAITSSESNVYITDAYFAPDHQLLNALKHAARRGVDVRLLLPSSSDEPFIISAERSHYAGLLKAGVRIYEWQGKMLHAKTATLDGVWSTVGTSNLDWWSIARDNELNAVMISHSFGDDMNLMFKHDLENATEIKLDQWKHRGIRERIDEMGASLIEPML
jgi:cardiolipin synthase